MTHVAIEFLACFAVSAILMSFVEHQVHRRLMHRQSLLCGLPVFKKIFEHHAILHHGHYHQVFSDEPVAPGQDRGVRLSIREGFFEALPVAALIALVSWHCAITFVMVVCLHHFLWNKIHLEMHKPEQRFFSDWPMYQFLARHHYLHHRHPDKNFNVILPLADYVLGTNIRATRSDLIKMYRTGLRKRVSKALP